MTFKQRAEEICRKVMGFPDVKNDVLSLRGEIETALRCAYQEGLDKERDKHRKVLEVLQQELTSGNGVKESLSIISAELKEKV